MFLPVYFGDRLEAVKNGNTFYALNDQTFLKWLEDEGKTFEQWKSENPNKPWESMSIPEHRLHKLSRLNKALVKAVADIYDFPEERTQTLMSLLNKARTLSLKKPNNTYYQQCVGYLEGLEDWSLNGALEVYYTIEGWLEGKETHEEIEELNWDSEIAAWLALDQHWEIAPAAYLLRKGAEFDAIGS